MTESFQKNFVIYIWQKNPFPVSLFSYTSQMTSNCGKVGAEPPLKIII